MSGAPERMAFGPVEYTRTDLAEAALSAARAEGRREGLLEAAGIADGQARVFEYDDEVKGPHFGRNLVDPRKLAAAIRAAAEVSP